MKQTLKNIIRKNFSTLIYFYRFLGWYRTFLVLFLGGLVAVLDGLGITMFLPLLQMVDGGADAAQIDLGKMSVVIDFIKSLGLELNLIVVIVFMCIFFILKGITKYASLAYVVLMQQFFIRQIRLDILQSMNRLGFKFFVKSEVGRIQNTLTTEVVRMELAFQNYFAAFQYLLMVLVYVGFAFLVDAQFALLVAAGGIITNFLYKMVYELTKQASRVLTKDMDRYHGEVIQHVFNFKYLKATGLMRRFSEKLERSVYRIEGSNKKIGYYRSLLTAVREPMMILVLAAVIVLQVHWLQAPIGPILISLLFFYRALASLTHMQNSWNTFLGFSGSMESVAEFQKVLKEHADREGKQPFEKFRSGIDLHDVSFSYEEEPVLQDITLSIQKRETVAFVGSSGSGKTTLVNLIAGLLPFETGAMEIDGINRDVIDINSYQARIGYICQEPVIFTDTIYNNVTFWASDTPENRARYERAVRQAAIADFIDTLPEKEHTQLGNSGINLSGGQKQRISIARELFKDIDILIMDEATSALDSETEKAIQENIDGLKGRYTILIVAHRLATIKNADRIVLMKNGRIEQIGSYQELMEKAGNFKRMVELQEL